MPAARPSLPPTVPLPAILALPWLNGWVRVSADLAPLVTDDDGRLLAHWCNVLDRLLAVGPRQPFLHRTCWAGQVFAVAIDPGGPMAIIASDRGAAERALLDLASANSVQVAHDPDKLAALEALVAALDVAQHGQSPLDIEVVSGLRLTDLPYADLLDHPTQLHGIARQTNQIGAMLDAERAHYQPPWMEQLAQWGLTLTESQPSLRNHLLRFVAALPALESDQNGQHVVPLLLQALRQALTDPDLPTDVRRALQLAVSALPLLPDAWAVLAIRRTVQQVARQFLAGTDAADAAPTLQRLTAAGRDVTLDRLGELVVSEEEAERYLQDVLVMMQQLAGRFGRGERNRAGLLRAHVSVKCSALAAVYDGDDPDGALAVAGPRLLQILRLARDLQVCVQLDAEHRPVRDLTLHLLRATLAQLDAEPAAHPIEAGIVVQAYLQDAEHHLAEVLALARCRPAIMPIRLVKGAYWDAETMQAAAHNQLPHQFVHKPETDLQFQRLTAQILAAGAAGSSAVLCLASHNLRDHAHARALYQTVFQSAPQPEHQVLHQTAEALASAMTALGWAVRVYLPVGSLLMGMAYLVRRILENSSQVGVLTLARHGTPLAEVLRRPQEALAGLQAEAHKARPPRHFATLPPLELHVAEQRALWTEALQQPLPVVSHGGRSGPLLRIFQPADPHQPLGQIAQSSLEDVAQAVARASALAPAWAALPQVQRCQWLIRAGEVTRAHRLPLAALIAQEAGKPRREALADVDEAVDFLHFYAQEAANLAPQWAASTEALGVVAVVAPWNFPLAIAVGMSAAALVVGNTVVLKSAESTPLVVQRWLDLLQDAGLPAVVTHVVGPGEPMGAALVTDPRVSGVCFTGSLAVGRKLQQAVTAKVDHRGWPRRLVAELGGKNAIVVCASADLDEAVSVILQSAFGHAGQKCSAASRVVADASIAGPLLARLVAAARDLRVGRGTEPGTQVGPLIRSMDRDRLRQAAQLAWQEWLGHGGDPLAPRCDRSQEVDMGRPDGWFVGPVVLPATVAQALDPHSTAQREWFGPLLQVISVHDEAEAVTVCNATPYALTAGIASQDPEQIDRLIRQLRAGNLYVNRPITGARVGVEPFGGFGWSGTGPKAGSRLALLPWLRPKSARPDMQQTREALEAVQQALAGQPIEVPGHPNPALLQGPLTATLQRLDATQWLDRATLLLLQRLVREVVPHLDFQRTPERETITLPGQRTHLLWLRPRGWTVVVATANKPQAFALVQTVIAQLCGNPVTVLALTKESHDLWQAWLVWLELDAVDLLQPDPVTIRSVLDQPQVATVVVESPVSLLPKALPLLLGPQDGPHFRQLLSPDLTPVVADTEYWLQLHRLPTVIAENTMRHGAVLDA